MTGYLGRPAPMTVQYEVRWSGRKQESESWEKANREARHISLKCPGVDVCIWAGLNLALTYVDGTIKKPPLKRSHKAKGKRTNV